MTDPELDKDAVAEALRRDAKVDRDEEVTDEIGQIDRIAEALADEDPATR